MARVPAAALVLENSGASKFVVSQSGPDQLQVFQDTEQKDDHIASDQIRRPMPPPSGRAAETPWLQP